MWIGLLHIRACSRRYGILRWRRWWKRTRTDERGEGGGRGADERGKNRDAPDWHEGLRLLAALRQLGGVRRGIEIANAHYGYFPIEGRMPLPVSYHASRSFSFRSLPATPTIYRDLSFSYSRLCSLSSPCSFTPQTQFVLFHRCLTFSHHIFVCSHISSPYSFLLALYSPHSLLFSLPLLRNLMPSPFFLFLFVENGNAHAGKRIRSRSHFPIFHSCLSLTFPLPT